jgi:predicted amidophosphoribosyltransferase
MTDDITYRPEQADKDSQLLQREELVREKVVVQQAQTQMLANSAQGVACPQCGTVNEPEAMFCASCGKPLRMGTCPSCGSEIDPEADFCEVCHHYIKHDVCSFCGASIGANDAFCPECGSPRGGIICPTCKTLNDFSFCKQCGTPLTEEAKALVKELKKQPEYQELVKVSKELEELNLQFPITSERDIVRSQMNDKLRERVLLLLAQDKGVVNPVIPAKMTRRLNKDELTKMKQDKMQQITALLDKMALPPQSSPAKARNYAMAQKPMGTRLAWICNFKHAMHSSPCGCAKPQMGGKWVILGKNSKQEIKDDK